MSSGSSQVAIKPKKTKWRPLYFGYVLDDRWILRYAVRNKLHLSFTPEALQADKDISPEDVDVMESIIMSSFYHLLRNAAVLLSSMHGSVKTPDGDLVHCIVLATNDHADNLPVPPPEKYARLKEILGTTEEPSWYYAWR